MTTIEYEGTRVEVPDGWDEITLGRYERVCGMRPETARQRVELVAEVCGTSAEVLMGWPAEIFNRMVEILGFLFREAEEVVPRAELEIEGVRYVVPIGDKLSLGAWVDVDEVQKRGENILSGVLAIICRPVGEAYDGNNNEERQRLFAGLPVSRVWPVMAFFLRRRDAFVKRTVAFSKLARGIDRLVRSTESLRGRGDGIRLSRIWRRGVSWILIVLLRYRWRRFLRSCSSEKTRSMPKGRKEN